MIERDWLIVLAFIGAWFGLSVLYRIARTVESIDEQLRERFAPPIDDDLDETL